MTVECITEDPRWENMPFDRLVTKAVEACLRHLGLDPNAWEVSVLATNDQHIQTLNQDFRDKDQPTNVLSWPSAERASLVHGQHPAKPDGDAELGDIALSYDTCQQEAADQNICIEDHISHLIVHGTLHLLGYDHQHDQDADLMESVETAILAKLGISDPYK